MLFQEMDQTWSRKTSRWRVLAAVVALWWSAGAEYLYLHNVQRMSLQKKRIQKVEPAYLEHSQVDPLCLLLLMPITNLLQLFLCQCQMDRKLRTDSRARICLSQTSLVIITQHAWCCTISFRYQLQKLSRQSTWRERFTSWHPVSRSMLLQRIIDHWLGCLQDRTRCNVVDVETTLTDIIAIQW